MGNRVVWWNGAFIPESEARLSIYDSALMFGDMCFEMTRSFNKKQFKLKDHIGRLMRSVRYLRIPLDWTDDQIEKGCHAVVEANQQDFEEDDEHRLMINVSRGLLGIYQQIDGATIGPNLIISDFPLRWTTAGMGKLFDQGVNCVTPSQRAIPAVLLEPKVKNRSRIHYLMANIEASLFKGENVWPLLLDTDGFIAEGTGYNFFIAKGDMLLTPEGRNCLRGVSRDFIFDISVSCDESNLELYDVYDADEAFVTGTPFCMLPVVSLNGIKIGTGKPGPFYNKLLQRWSEMVEVDIKAQIQAWDNGASGGTTPYQFK